VIHPIGLQGVKVFDVIEFFVDHAAVMLGGGNQYGGLTVKEIIVRIGRMMLERLRPQRRGDKQEHQAQNSERFEHGVLHLWKLERMAEKGGSIPGAILLRIAKYSGD